MASHLIRASFWTICVVSFNVVLYMVPKPTEATISGLSEFVSSAAKAGQFAVQVNEKITEAKRISAEDDAMRVAAIAAGSLQETLLGLEDSKQLDNAVQSLRASIEGSTYDINKEQWLHAYEVELKKQEIELITFQYVIGLGRSNLSNQRSSTFMKGVMDAYIKLRFCENLPIDIQATLTMYLNQIDNLFYRLKYDTTLIMPIMHRFEQLLLNGDVLQKICKALQGEQSTLFPRANKQILEHFLFVQNIWDENVIAIRNRIAESIKRFRLHAFSKSLKPYIQGQVWKSYKADPTDFARDLCNKLKQRYHQLNGLHFTAIVYYPGIHMWVGDISPSGSTCSDEDTETCLEKNWELGGLHLRQRDGYPCVMLFWSNLQSDAIWEWHPNAFANFHELRDYEQQRNFVKNAGFYNLFYVERIFPYVYNQIGWHQEEIQGVRTVTGQTDAGTSCKRRWDGWLLRTFCGWRVFFYQKKIK